MARIDAQPLTDAYNKFRDSSQAANDLDSELEQKYAAAIDAIRNYNAALEATKAAFGTVEKSVAAVKVAADALAEQSGGFPAPIPEPAPWQNAPIRGAKRL